MLLAKDDRQVDEPGESDAGGYSDSRPGARLWIQWVVLIQREPGPCQGVYHYGDKVGALIGVDGIHLEAKASRRIRLNCANGMIVDLYRRSAIGWVVATGHVKETAGLAAVVVNFQRRRLVWIRTSKPLPVERRRRQSQVRNERQAGQEHS